MNSEGFQRFQSFYMDVKQRAFDYIESIKSDNNIIQNNEYSTEIINH